MKRILQPDQVSFSQYNYASARPILNCIFAVTTWHDWTSDDCSENKHAYHSHYTEGVSAWGGEKSCR